MNKIQFDFASDEEKYFYQWLLELYNLGYIDWICPYQKSYLITDELRAERVIQMKTKTKVEEFVLTKKRSYTPDFIFKFNKKAYKLLYHDKEDGYSNRPFFYCNNNRGMIYVDVKGSFTKGLSSAITFPDRQSIMGSRFNIYVQKVIPYSSKAEQDTLFKSTFTPQLLIDTEVYAKDRKGKWKKGDSKLKYKVVKVNNFIC